VGQASACPAKKKTRAKSLQKKKLHAAQVHAHAPKLRRTVESDKSRWNREMGSFSLKWVSRALATPRFPSEFSKSIGLTYKRPKVASSERMYEVCTCTTPCRHTL
jgi:hypothetical protein